MDIIYLRDLHIETIIGVYDWEREIKQVVNLHIEMATDIRPAANSRDINDALNYKTVAERLTDFISNSEFFLIESLAEACSNIIINEFHVPWLKLTLSKPAAVSNCGDVGVIIERGEKG